MGQGMFSLLSAEIEFIRNGNRSDDVCIWSCETLVYVWKKHLPGLLPVAASFHNLPFQHRAIHF